MKTEGDFNSELSTKLRMFWPSLYHLKTSDKFTSGISDFLIWRSSKTLALETKFVSEIPSEKALLLKHPFSGAQITFLESMLLSGNLPYGAVYIKETKYLYFIHYNDIPKTGNWKTGDFFAKDFTKYKMWSELETLIEKTL